MAYGLVAVVVRSEMSLVPVDVLRSADAAIAKALGMLHTSYVFPHVCFPRLQLVNRWGCSSSVCSIPTGKGILCTLNVRKQNFGYQLSLGYFSNDIPLDTGILCTCNGNLSKLSNQLDCYQCFRSTVKGNVEANCVLLTGFST